MTDTVKPALTRDQWAVVLHHERDRNPARYIELPGNSGPEDSIYADENDRHYLAAVCLHDEPFGFTREDVEKLRSLTPDGTWGPGKYWEIRGEDLPEANAWLDSLASRIAALLPPDDTEGQ